MPVLSPLDQIHGTVIAFDGEGILFRGPSACGKSDLALRLIDQGAIVDIPDVGTQFKLRGFGQALLFT